MDTVQVNPKDAMALRQRTGLGIMDCKDALAQNGGDMNKAEAWLREKLKGKMDTRTDRPAGQGCVAVCVQPGRASIVEADWVEVSYRWSSDTNEPGLFRQERTHTASAPVSTNLLTEIEPLPGNSTNTILPSGGIPLSEAIAYLRFRYWNGTRWQTRWDKPEPPLAVEISLGLEPIEDEFTSDATDSEEGPSQEYPFEVFRRVIALPAALTPSSTELEPATTDAPSAL